MQAKVTIVDVARAADVSMKTVSRVLNREPNVTEPVRRRVMEVAEALGYSPRLSARRLAGSRSYLLGLLFDNPSEAYLAGVQHGAIRRCRQEHYHLIVEPLDSRAPDLGALEDAMARLRPDGVILTPPLSDNADILDLMRRMGRPCVCIGAGRAQDVAARVGIDETQAAFDMTRHLLDLGHRRIAFIKGHPDHEAAARRLDGFMKAMEDAGCAAAPDQVRQGMFSFESGLALGGDLLDRADRPSAIFAANDDMALGVLAAAEKIGLRAPRDVSVAGFDDSPAARYAFPPLTTVRQPVEEMAEIAAGVLIDIAAGREPETRAACVAHTLVPRESTGAPV